MGIISPGSRPLLDFERNRGPMDVFDVYLLIIALVISVPLWLLGSTYLIPKRFRSAARVIGLIVITLGLIISAYILPHLLF